MASSTTAWRRWSASSATAVPARSVTNAWWRQSGQRVAWAPTRRVRRTTSRPPALPARVVSATWAAPPSGSSMSVQASSLMAAIAAVTGLVWRTVIENRMPWRRQEAMTLPDQNPASPPGSAARLPWLGGPDRPVH
jgi:hypothetical protein